MTTFEACAREAFKTAGHVFTDDDLFVDENLPTAEADDKWCCAVIYCQRCHQDYSYDSDTGNILGGPDDDRYFNIRCPAPKILA